MKPTIYIIAIAIGFSSLLSCQNTNKKATEPTKKEVSAVTKPEKTTFTISGMTCAVGCAKTIEKKLSKTEGIQKATVNFEKKEAVVEYDSAILNNQKIKEIVESVGDGETYKVSSFKSTNKI